MVNPKTIAIIGGTGKMGKLFVKAFEGKKYRVIVSSRKTEINNIDAARQADVVIVSVPIRDTERVIKEIGPYVRKNALLTDFTSVKVMPSRAMLKYSRAEVIAGHPLFGPSNNLKGKNFTLYPLRGKSYFNWYKKLLESLGLKIIVMSSDEHDKIMAIVQCLNQLSNLSFGYTLKKANLPIKKTEELSTPNYLLKIYPIGRLLSQDPSLYSDIEIENPYSKKIAKIHLKAIKEIYRTIRRKDKEGFERIFKETREFLGDFNKEANQKSDKIVNFIGELNKKKNKKNGK
jgi:prephenate dehydrogenase